MQVLECACGECFGQPVSYEEGEIKPAVAQATFGDRGLVEFVDANGGEFYVNARIDGLEEPRLLGERVFEVSVVAERDAEGVHFSSGCALREPIRFMRQSQYIARGRDA